MSDYRFEKKYILPRNELHRFQAWLGATDLRPAYPRRMIHNIYFDTPHLNSYYEVLAGISQRQKLRLRWYNHLKDQMVHWEVKEKRNNMVRKFLISIPVNNTNWKEAPIKLLNEAPAPSAFSLSHTTTPSLYNSYSRDYYENTAGIRLTIDDQLFFQAPHKSVPQQYSARDEFVIEIKYPPQEESHAKKLIQKMPFALDKNSKYQLGIASISPWIA
jgi:hypothetical protein